MKLGIIGLGVVGSAYNYGLKKIGYKTVIHDIKLNTKIDDLTDTKLLFISVSTPSKKNGDCDVSKINNVLRDLIKINYKGYVVIVSTSIPGTTDNFIKEYKKLKILNVPELLRERHAKKDFLKPKVIVIGTKNKKYFNYVSKIYKKLTANVIMMKPTEAEIFKYYNNCYASLRVIFANIIYELCKKKKSDYKLIKNSYIKTGKAVDMYLDVDANLRGYGGVCLPKDTIALANLLKKLNLNFDLIRSIHNDNQKIKTTVFKGMRL